MGNLVINKGLSIVESTSGFNNILVVVDYLSLSVSNGVDPAVSAFIIPNSVSSEKNIFFASNIIADKRLTSAGGRIANVQIHGNITMLCMYVYIFVLDIKYIKYVCKVVFGFNFCCIPCYTRWYGSSGSTYIVRENYICGRSDVLPWYDVLTDGDRAMQQCSELYTRYNRVYLFGKHLTQPPIYIHT